MRFYLGTHRPNWLAVTDVPLFVSNRVLQDRRSLPVARGRWVLDGGGYSELSLYGEWRASSARAAAIGPPRCGQCGRATELRRWCGRCCRALCAWCGPVCRGCICTEGSDGFDDGSHVGR